jgi:hypothetical protein
VVTSPIPSIPGTSEARIFVLPMEQATLMDHWNVMGLRATGTDLM